VCWYFDIDDSRLLEPCWPKGNVIDGTGEATPKEANDGGGEQYLRALAIQQLSFLPLKVTAGSSPLG